MGDVGNSLKILGFGAGIAGMVVLKKLQESLTYKVECQVLTHNEEKVGILTYPEGTKNGSDSIVLFDFSEDVCTTTSDLFDTENSEPAEQKTDSAAGGIANILNNVLAFFIPKAQ